MRAFRVNLFRGGDLDQVDARAALRTSSPAGTWRSTSTRRDLPELAPRLAVAPRLVIDHLGMSQAGLPALLELVKDGAYVKASGFGRIDVDVLARCGRSPTSTPPRCCSAPTCPATRARRPFEDGRHRARAEAAGARALLRQRRRALPLSDDADVDVRAARAGSAAAAAREPAGRATAAAGRAGRTSSRARGRRGVRTSSSSPVLDQQVRAEHRGQPAQRLEPLALARAGGSGRDHDQHVELAARRWAERQARRTTRSSRSSSPTKASSRSAIGCGSSATSRRSSTFSATWRSATSRSARRFSTRKKPFSAGAIRACRVDLAGLQPGDQVLGREVDEHDLVGLGQLGVGHRLAHLDAGQLGHLVVERLEVLDVDGREDVDPGGEHVGDVLVALGVLEPGRVGVRELVDQAQLRAAGEDARQVHLLELHAAVGDAPARRAARARRPGARSSARPCVSSSPMTTSRPASASAWASASMR